ncbi:MAG TPA: SH3 domain-containing protein [Candidatus Limnocylindrales bacterium]|nr:SH3 domain-containing protein [Candidatus Limnocylindrales bacterium]
MVFALGLLPVRRRRGPDDPRWRLRPAGAFRTAVQPTRSASAELIPSSVSPGESIRLPWLLGSSDTPSAPSEAGGVVAREPLRFRAPARPGVERRAIAYRFIRVTDQPDDNTSAEVCRLDRGDEIEIIGEHDGFLQVRTPNGLQGWVQRMVIVG